jgi:hypothetical protein
MTENIKDTLKSLLAKLSAVRVTLTDAEQSLLDQLILSSSAEVQAHAHKAYSKDEAKAYEADEARAMAKAFKPEEAKAMDTDEARAMAKAYKPDEAKSYDADESRAMARVYKPDEARAAEADEARATARVYKPDEARAAEADEARANRLLFLEEPQQTEADEVTAHSIPTNLMNRPGFPNPIWVKIIYDHQLECYKVI